LAIRKEMTLAASHASSVAAAPISIHSNELPRRGINDPFQRADRSPTTMGVTVPGTDGIPA
jgi:hypothetical protein